MSRYRGSFTPTDHNESDIVEQLRKIPGVKVETGHDDIFVGYQGKNYWFEIKNPDAANKDGKVFESNIKPSQKKLREHWTGQYSIVVSLDQILAEINIVPYGLKSYHKI